MLRRAPFLALLALVVAGTVNPHPLPLPIADTVVNEGVSIEGPLINNIGLPTVL
ncbi:hypothetical protein AB0N81_01750 [Streptomyces sp. NPDC093510]|uniref:hypothetical protein n=1 Tax=Streptomyces sp. NPDC093510 TaxID=3155199 RepID=UPI0034466B9F